MPKILNIIFVLFMIFTLNSNCFAINWLEVRTPKGKIAYLDTDSIKEKDKYYFYNIKYQDTPDSSFKILTVQSGLRNSFSARLKLYKPEEYEALKGDYENIALLETDKLEAPEFGSIIQCCHKKVREIMHTQKNMPDITLDNQG